VKDSAVLPRARPAPVGSKSGHSVVHIPPSALVRWAMMLVLLLTTMPRGALGQPTPSTRPAHLFWDKQGKELLVSFDFRDMVDETIRQKLTRGLPTRFLITALTYRPNSPVPLASTYQNCKVTWHVWEEMYLVELNRASDVRPQRHWTPTIDGVLRRCTAPSDLVLTDSSELPVGSTIVVEATVRINPLDEELMNKLRQWVTRPSRSTTAAPGSALFSTFTGLFMQRLGDAEKTQIFRTPVTTPTTRK
jgi:hypothetical protein